ncbi:MAG: hypothetical protein A3F54_01895 [Candidatus Kerfeldbacteria bacterium RIFCSPHIGHO2_12_FULL_48_17]|uniref:Uncharacterized protein n=1 Tax=Candidatus Kerfeldbacteria bacterium RIFCSPHIGHO2_12_FULL_48_17 TaxID=1798542 RepID=A0A1G2AY01_9BACT|nr:MAG: hypothetical protein A3F54_01895 [Candidatus Kerfeldbacteria bacterium RIFCSPHIGHO2_12_FULL_48_17]
MAQNIFVAKAWFKDENYATGHWKILVIASTERDLARDTAYETWGHIPTSNFSLTEHEFTPDMVIDCSPPHGERKRELGHF